LQAPEHKAHLMAGSGGQQLLAGDPSAFNLMIAQMLSPQNEQRRAAEALFGEAKKQGDLTASSLVALLRQSQQVDVRALCAVLLRKVRRRAGAHVLDRPARARRGADGGARPQVLTKDDPSLWPTLSANVQVAAPPAAGRPC